MDTIFRKIARYFHNLWLLGILDPEKGLWTATPSPNRIAYLRAQNARGCHIFMKPIRLDRYLLADDIPREILSRHHRLPNGQWKPARMVVETSPGNFQVWIHSKRPLSSDEKRFWLNKLRSDPAAHPENRWGRCPGFRNTKEKHRSSSGLYPLARLIWVDWTARADIPHPEMDVPKPSIVSHPSRRGIVCQTASLARSRFLRGDESATDLAYALSLARRGFSDSEIQDRIRSERSNWANHRGQSRIARYLERTIRRARAIINAA